MSSCHSLGKICNISEKQGALSCFLRYSRKENYFKGDLKHDVERTSLGFHGCGASHHYDHFGAGVGASDGCDLVIYLGGAVYSHCHCDTKSPLKASVFTMLFLHSAIKKKYWTAKA